MLNINMNEEFPYNLPIWRRKYSAESPNKKIIAEINPAYEISMGNPTYGTLILSNGINIGRCNPSFIWSNDSKCLAIPQYTTNWFFGFGKQRLLVIDVNENQGWQSKKLAYYIQPEKFESGKLTATLNPFRSPEIVIYNIPEDLKKFNKIELPPNNSLKPIGNRE
jgi:hypothetical protein